MSPGREAALRTHGTIPGVTSRYPVAVDAHVRIRMADGVQLAATIHRPDGPAAFPALLESVPYRKDDWLIPGHLPMHAEFAARGYASVLVDVRGTGSSEGVAEDEYTEAEITDNLAVLAWLREQPWCDGSLGMFGISWGGFAALQAAMRRPPGLRAIIPVGATHDRYALDVHYIGGTLHVNELVTWPVEMVVENALPPDPERFGPGWRDEWLRRLEATPQWTQAWLRHQRRDGYWRHGSPFVDYAAIEAPVLAINGFNDGYRDFVLELLEHLRRASARGAWAVGPQLGACRLAGSFDRWPGPHGSLVGPVAARHRQRGRSRADAGRLPGRADAGGRIPRADARQMVVRECLAARAGSVAGRGKDMAARGWRGPRGSGNKDRRARLAAAARASPRR